MSRRAKGEGSIYFLESKNCYTSVLQIGITKEGKRKRKYFYGKTKKEVKKKMDDYKLLNPISGGKINEFTVSEWFKYWLFNIKKRDIKPKSFERYESLYRNYIEGSEIGNIPLYKLKLNNLQVYYNRLLDEGKSPQTIIQINTKLKTCLTEAERSGYIEKNYCKLIVLPKVKKENKKEVFTQEEQKQFIEMIKGDSMEVLFLVAIGTGLRIGELLGLKWSDIDFNKRVLTVNRALQKGYIFNDEGKKQLQTTLNEPKTINAFRDVPIPTNIFSRLEEYKINQDDVKKSNKLAYKDNDFIFCNDIGKPLDLKQPPRRFKKIQTNMGIPKDEQIKFHGLRKTYATRLFENRIPPKTVQTLMGHSSIDITLDIYTQVMEKEKLKAIDKIDSIF